MKNFLIVLTALALFQCGDKKPSLSGDEPVKAEDFIAFFPELALPYQLKDSAVNKKDNDSLLISSKVFTQFVPDSIAEKIFGKNTKPKIYPLGRVVVSNDEIYLATKSVMGSKREVLLLAFNEDNEFSGFLSFMKIDTDRTTRQTSSIDRQLNIHKSVSRPNTDGTISDGKEVYVYNKEASNFMLIMTEALDENANELINPIDTLPVKNKYSADYIKSKGNIVSVRDATKQGRFMFFIHIEANNKECQGELKGEAVFTSANTAEYRLAGDPCVMQFSFTSNAVTLKEVEGCGARRDLKCSFNGRYPKKKQAKTAKKKAAK